MYRLHWRYYFTATLVLSTAGKYNLTPWPQTPHIV
jgi:hypothetical protein